jgi:glycosyltransferase involved in cell wall biosynthesis
MVHALHIVAGLDAAHGGPSYSIPKLCRSLAEIGADIDLYSVKGRDPPFGDEINGSYRVRHFDWNYRGVPILQDLRWSSGLRTAVLAAATRAEIIHDHGIWLMPNVHAGRAAARSRKPLIVSPRGMLAPAALAFSRAKKRIFWQLVQGPAIREAACFHATTEQEYEEIRAFGLLSPVAVIPNAIDLPPACVRSAAPADRGRTVLSLGRLHPIKGLDRLIWAWAKVEGRYPDWRLRIVGPAEQSYDHTLRELVTSLGLSRVSIEGPLYGDLKTAAYRASDLFVLATLTENFGIAVAEALATETPVISTWGAPWARLESERCGWWVDHGVEPLAAALADAMAMPYEALRAMGVRGRVWMTRDFSWYQVAREMLNVYRWLARGAEPPATVRFA